MTYTDDVISELQEVINGLEATVNSLRADLTASRGFSADLGKVIDRMEGEAKDLKAEATAATRTAARWESKRMTLHKSGPAKPLPTVDPGPALGANGLTYPAHAMQAANDHAAQMTAERDAALAEVARLRQGIAKAASQAAVHADHAHDHYGVHVERLCEDAQEDRHRRAASDLTALLEPADLLAPADGSGS